MLEKLRQNTLRVTTIQQKFEACVDLDLQVRTGEKLKTSLKAIISKLFFEDNFEENDKVALNALVSKWIHHINIGLEEYSSDWQRQALEILVRNVNGGSNLSHIRQIGPLQFLNELKFNTAFEYYGFLGRGKTFSLVYRRRPKRQHFQRYVGVGYSDKGAAKIISTDASPSWQTTAGSYQKVVKEAAYGNSIRAKSLRISSRSVISLPVGKTLDGRRRFDKFSILTTKCGKKILLNDLPTKTSVTWEVLEKLVTDLESGFFPLKYKGNKATYILDRRQNRGSLELMN